jgi:hypothetical protein
MVGCSGVGKNINWSNRGGDFLGDCHEYTFSLGGISEVEISLQLYRNNRDHYRLFAFTRCGANQGMTFSVNLTTKKESSGIIFLEQSINFKERYPDAEDGGRQHRWQKQIVLCDILRRIGMDVDDECKLVLGVFDSKKRSLIDGSAEDFLNNFIVTALLKGHFQVNKGFELGQL